MHINGNDIRTVIVACDAGMGSSVMLASQLRKQLSKHNVTVEHTPVNSIPEEADVIVCHESLADRARASVGDTPIIAVQVFIGDPAIKALVTAVSKGEVLNV